MGSKEQLFLNHKTQDLEETATIQTQGFSLAMELLMLVLLELQLESLDNLLQTKSSTLAPEVAPETRIQTTEFSVATLITFFWELLQDLLELLLLMLPLEAH